AEHLATKSPSQEVLIVFIRNFQSLFIVFQEPKGITTSRIHKKPNGDTFLILIGNGPLYIRLLSPYGQGQSFAALALFIGIMFWVITFNSAFCIINIDNKIPKKIITDDT